ncbi:MAG: hypothetical protein K5869_00550 [Saccharofermentans sp.]|nr:hypothetical protein [Saccharofermentans sp.]
MEKELESTTNDKALPEEKQEAKAAAEAVKPEVKQDPKPSFGKPEAHAEKGFQPDCQPVYPYGYQPGYQQAPQFMTQCTPQPSKPEKKRGKAAKVIALALCCALAGGAVGAGGIICLRHFGIWGRPGRNITRTIGDDAGTRGGNRNGQGRSADQNGGSDSFRNRGGNNGGQRKGTGRDGQYKDNVQPGGRNNFGRGRHSQGESNINGQDQGTTTTPDKGSGTSGQTTPAPEQTTPTTGGEAKA